MMTAEDDLLSLKLELKCWESMFARKYGRKPTKDDINASSSEIRDSYRRYAKVKKDKLNASSVSVEPDESTDDGIFGKDLNKKPVKEVKEVKKPPLKHDSTTSWRPKLKVTRLKDVKNDENMLGKEGGIEETMEMQLDDSNIMKTSAGFVSPIVNISARKLGASSQHKIKRRHSLIRKSNVDSIDWLESCKESLKDGAEMKMKSKQPIPTNAADISHKNQPKLNASYNEEETTPLENPTEGIKQKILPQVLSNEKENVKSQYHCSGSMYSMSELIEGKQFSSPPKSNEERYSPQSWLKEDSVQSNIRDNAIDKSTVVNEDLMNCKNPPNNYNDKKDCENKKGSRKEENREDNMVTNELPDNGKQLQNKKGLRKRKKKGNSTEDEESPGKEQQKPASKVRNKRKREETEAAQAEEDANSKKLKLSKKAAEKGKKRLVSDNFVKIDMRKKTYVRGLKKTSVSTLKRRSWRSKTAFEQPGGQSGKKTCFKCGGEGHWAKFCRGKPKKVDPFVKLDSEKQSLEYNALMEGRGSCFNDLYSQQEHGENCSNGTTKNFSVDDIMAIEPCWPRKPYIVEKVEEESFEPLCEPDDERPSESALKKVQGALRNFGFTEFREGQHNATARVVSGLSTLVILATGSGKSLCYQLPAFMYFKERKWITLVVSPLVALMQDQVAGLPSCLPGATLNSNMTKLQQQKVITKLKEGKIAILLVSPETLVSGAFGTGVLPPRSSLPPIAFACIDEAHCLSEWSHNFRPSYLQVCKALREHYQIKCLLGLTATASYKTAKSVTRHLGVPGEGSIIRDPNPIPENLQITASRDDHRDMALVELLQQAPFDACESIIVYVTRRMDADRLAVLLRTSLPEFVPKKALNDDERREKKKIKVKARKNNEKPTWWNCEAYHAGLTPAQRKRVQNQFMFGELRIVVATVAFGMGLDKSDVRSVIHYNLPKSFENYVQEIGRAGRDGKPSYCHVFLSDDMTDLCELKRHVYGDAVDRQTIRKFVDLLFPDCDCKKLHEQHQQTLNQHEQQSLQHYQQELDDSDLEMFFSEEFNEETNEFDSLNKNKGNDETIDDSGDIRHSNDVDFERKEREYMRVKNSSENNENRNEISTKNYSDISEENSVLRNEISSQDRTVQCNQDSISSKPSHNFGREDSSNPHISNRSSYLQDSIHNEDVACHCSGHRIALPVDDTVSSLDVREEIISTMLVYLELHAKKWVEMFNPLRSFCSVKCYGGPEQYQLLLQKFPPVAIATKRLSKDELRDLGDRRQVEFDLVEIADAMCWDLLTVVRELKSLQWNMTFALDASLNGTGKSGIIVEMEKPSFHCTTAPGVGETEKEEIVDYIFNTVICEEKIRLLQLDALYCVLKELSCQHFWQVPSDERIDKETREKIGQFFLCDENQQLDYLNSLCTSDTEIHTPARRWNNIAGDIQALMVAHPNEKFTGRAIARIFQGIESPRYPAIVYGRDRRFWRQCLDVDFNELRIFTVKEIAKFRS